RTIELLRALLAEQPDARIVVRSAAAEWLFRSAAPPGITLQPFTADTGVVQVDSLRLDEDATAPAAAQFYADFERRVDDEARIIGTLKADVVIGDIPPLAFAAAARAGVPSIAVANFTWDWIFSSYTAFDRLAAGVVSTIREAYASAPLALRLPMHGG